MLDWYDDPAAVDAVLVPNVWSPDVCIPLFYIPLLPFVVYLAVMCMLLGGAQKYAAESTVLD